MSETLFDIICGIGGSPAAEVASLRGWARANKGVAGAGRVLLIDSAYTKGQGIGERVRAALCEVLSLDVNHIALECFSNKPCIDELMRIYRCLASMPRPIKQTLQLHKLSKETRFIL